MSRKRERTEALKIISKIESNPELYFIIHYSCQGFYDIPDGTTPKINAIAIKNIKDGDIDSFSIQKTAEEYGYSNDSIEENYDIIERKMLDKYFSFLRRHSDMNYIHVNMRDGNFGFKAIEQRYKVLKGKPFYIRDDKKINFAVLLKNIYGYNYIEHPRMENLYRYNGLKFPMFLSGKEEAEAFENKEYNRLYQSTLTKVEIYSILLNLTINKKLKTKAKIKDIYGISFQALYEYCKSTWWVSLIWSLLIMVLGALVGVCIGKMF